MTYTGTIKNGVVILPPGTNLPDGAEVDVTLRQPPTDDSSFAAIAKSLAKPRPHLPADYALNHGHYVRGEPKK